MDQGYELYQYLKELKVLNRFDQHPKPDGYLLNLLAIKPHLASRLQEKGIITQGDFEAPGPEAGCWEQCLSAMSWTASLLPIWQQNKQNDAFNDYFEAMDLLCVAQDPKATASIKFGQAYRAVQQLAKMYQNNQLASRGPAALTLSRSLYTLGLREEAVQVLEIVVDQMEKGTTSFINLPFFPPLSKFDHMPVRDSVEQWILTRCKESLIYLRSHSGYFNSPQDQHLLLSLHKSPERRIESQRRLALMVMSQGQKVRIRPDSSLVASEHLNAKVWAAIGQVRSPKTCKRFPASPHAKRSETTGPAPLGPAELLEKASASSNTEIKENLQLEAIGCNRNYRPAYLAYSELLLKKDDTKGALITLMEARRLGKIPNRYEQIIETIDKDFSEYKTYTERTGKGGISQADHIEKILVVTNLLPPQEMGGFGRTMWEFCQMLLRRGHILRILTADMPHLYREYDREINDVESHVLRDLRLCGDWREGKTVMDKDENLIREKLVHNQKRILQELEDFQPTACLVGNLDFVGYEFLKYILEKQIPVVHRLGNSVPGYQSQFTPESEFYSF